MAPTKAKSQCLLLNSSNGSRITDKPWQWTAYIEPGLITCGPDEYMTLTLERFFTVYSWDWIPQGAFFVVSDDSGAAQVTVNLPQGNPVLDCLAKQISSSVDSDKFSCTYDPSTNRMTFTSAFGIVLTFPSLDVANLLGFDQLTVGPQLSITSTRIIRPLPIDTIAVNIVGVRPAQGSYHCTNVASSFVTPCTLLGVIPMHARPYTMLEWENSSNSFEMVLADKTLSNLTFSLTDWSGKPLKQIGQHYMTLRVDTYSKNGLADMQTVASGIANDVRMMRVMKMAKSSDQHAPLQNRK
jgi:hypothetical protein